MKDDRKSLLLENLERLTSKAKDSAAVAELARTLQRCAPHLGLTAEKNA